MVSLELLVPPLYRHARRNSLKRIRKVIFKIHQERNLGKRAVTKFSKARLYLSQRTFQRLHRAPPLARCFCALCLRIVYFSQAQGAISEVLIQRWQISEVLGNAVSASTYMSSSEYIETYITMRTRYMYGHVSLASRMANNAAVVLGSGRVGSRTPPC